MPLYHESRRPCWHFYHSSSGFLGAIGTEVHKGQELVRQPSATELCDKLVRLLGILSSDFLLVWAESYTAESGFHLGSGERVAHFQSQHERDQHYLLPWIHFLVFLPELIPFFINQSTCTLTIPEFSHRMFHGDFASVTHFMLKLVIVAIFLSLMLLLNFKPTRGRVILWEGWSGVNNTNIKGEFFMNKLNTGTSFSCLSIWKNMVFTSKTLTSLKLQGCRLNDFGAIELSNLRQLSLKKIPIDKDIIKKFLESCPSIEDFRLVECMGLQKLHVPTLLSLKRVEVHKCFGLHSIEIKGTNLQTFSFFEKGPNYYDIELASCEHLRDLTVKASKMRDDWFQEQISKFPDLENLTLIECHSVKRMTTLSSKLKRLSLIKCKNLEDANILAPNLSSFEYTGQRLESCISSLESSRLQYVKIHFERGLSLSEREKFNESVGKLEGFTMVLQESKQKDVSIYEVLGGAIHSEGSGYKIELMSSQLVLREAIYRKLQECRPSCLSVYHSCDSKSIQLIEEMLGKREERPSCCHYYKNKCWKHCLKGFKFLTSKGCSVFKLEWRTS